MAKSEVRDKMLQYAHKFYINHISSESISIMHPNLQCAYINEPAHEILLLIVSFCRGKSKRI